MKYFGFILILLTCTLAVNAQKITYTEPDPDDSRSTQFEIIGKLNGKFHIYKNQRSDHSIHVYDNDMKQVDKIDLDFLPDKILDVNFINYSSYYYMIYQYQKRGIVYLAAAKMDADGKVTGKSQVIDTTEISFSASNKLYSVITSENKQFISASKINTKHNDRHIVVTVLYDKELNFIRKSRLHIPMPDKNDFLSEFNVDNEGNIVFLKAAGTSNNDNISKIALVRQQPASDSFFTNELNTEGLFLDDIRLKINNATNQYIISSLLSKSKRGNIDGVYVSVWDKLNGTEKVTTTLFNDELRTEAKGDASFKNAFNDYFIQNVYLRKDGGYMIAAECQYTTSRGNNFNRWDYMYGYGGYPYTYSDYYYFRNFGYMSPWNRGFFNNITRYYADNIMFLSFNANGEMEWSSVVKKSQYDDNADYFLSYSTVNTGDAIHVLYNVFEKRTQLLTDNTILSDGQIKRNPTFKNMDKGYEFMPKHGKQVGARQIIIPCQYRNYICFAKVDF